jgi:hypothetical protein
MLAMGTIRAENHKNGILPFVQLVSCKCSAVGRFINREFWNKRKADINRDFLRGICL